MPANSSVASAPAPRPGSRAWRASSSDLKPTDLFEIASYIARDDRAAAERLIDAMESKFQLLATSPRLGRLRTELAPGLRSLPFGNYVIFYGSLPDGIEVVRVLHGKRDSEPLFRA